ncbi:unnamed protein product [Spirodela intermedia]|uniref:3-ketoacyl-CoA synthase n=2 Tax=Spirodela intermedia TaxID=51605 RepID=A0A7I8IS92_SPIIN|nr:unnamed protein product [Spirodela intermedia]CAA6660868.1 unnamed protein product [Spirodela intermedia]CAA7397226.1 unnamed protein product [Spirodela intermedia]
MESLRVLTPIRLLQGAFFALLALTFAVHALVDSGLLLQRLSQHKVPLLGLLWCTVCGIVAYILTRARPVLLLDYACHKPSSEHRLSFEACEYFIRRINRYSMTSENFMRGIYHKSGLGDETYGPPFVFNEDNDAKLASAVEEAQEGAFSCVETVLFKSNLSPDQIDVVVVSCGMFTHSPSLSAMLVNRFGFNPNVKTYNLSGMGCSSGAAAVDLGARILSASREVRNVLVAVTESISLNWYFGDERSMLVTNCIFRVGSAAAVLTNDPARRCQAKMELMHSLRSHNGADDASYRAAYLEEDHNDNLGVSLKKDLIRVAGVGLREHIRQLAPRVLPLSEIVYGAYAAAAAWARTKMGLSNADAKPHVPDFTKAFEHICLHTGGKAVVESVQKLMRLPDETTEPARMTLHRFGNTSSSLIFYEMAYFDAKGKFQEGDRVWMIAFGTGFKVCSLVWKSLKPSVMTKDNPWKDCIHRYPLKAW